MENVRSASAGERTGARVATGSTAGGHCRPDPGCCTPRNVTTPAASTRTMAPTRARIRPNPIRFTSPPSQQFVVFPSSVPVGGPSPHKQADKALSPEPRARAPTPMTSRPIIATRAGRPKRNVIALEHDARRMPLARSRSAGSPDTIRPGNETFEEWKGPCRLEEVKGNS